MSQNNASADAQSAVCETVSGGASNSDKCAVAGQDTPSIQDVRLLEGSLYFEAEWYLQQYRDVSAAEIDAVLHYLKYGAARGYDPSPWFGTEAYLTQRPDVANAGMNPLVHFLRFGIAERPEAPAAAGVLVVNGTRPEKGGRRRILCEAEEKAQQVDGLPAQEGEESSLQLNAPMNQRKQPPSEIAKQQLRQQEAERDMLRNQEGEEPARQLDSLRHELAQARSEISELERRVREAEKRAQHLAAEAVVLRTNSSNADLRRQAIRRTFLHQAKVIERLQREVYNLRRATSILEQSKIVPPGNEPTPAIRHVSVVLKQFLKRLIFRKNFSE